MKLRPVKNMILSNCQLEVPSVARESHLHGTRSWGTYVEDGKVFDWISLWYGTVSWRNWSWNERARTQIYAFSHRLKHWPHSGEICLVCDGEIENLIGFFSKSSINLNYFFIFFGSLDGRSDEM